MSDSTVIPPTHFVTVVWGDDYIDRYLNVALCSQLATGNLPAWSDVEGVSYKVYTTTVSAARLNASPTFATLREVLGVEVLVNDDLERQGGKYAAMNACHHHAVSRIDASEGAMVVLSPDTVWADGSLAALRHVVESGKRVVMTLALRTRLESFLPALLRDDHGNDGAALSVDARDLVRLTIDHLHDYNRSMFWDGDDYNRTPSHVLWPVCKSGILAHNYHLHPLFIHPKRRGVTMAQTIDTDYFTRACPDLDDYHIVTDSDELLATEFSASDDATLNSHIGPDGSAKLRAAQSDPRCPPGADLKAAAVAVFGQAFATPMHRAFLREPIRLHAEAIDERWIDVESRARDVVTSIDAWHDKDARSLLMELFGGVL